MSDLVQRLRATSNWKREEYREWKDCTSVYDRTPFEAADEIERLTILLHTAADLLSTNRTMAMEYIERTAIEEKRLPAPTTEVPK